MIDAIIFAALLLLGYGFGQFNEKRHYRSIVEREQELQSVLVISSKHPPQGTRHNQQLVIGSVVVASDYFKSFVASLVNIFGGRVRTYEPLLDRGRREALLRVKEQAREINAAHVFNIRYETSRIGGGVTTIEVLAYGTALIEASGTSSNRHTLHSELETQLNDGPVTT